MHGSEAGLMMEVGGLVQIQIFSIEDKDESGHLGFDSSVPSQQFASAC
jgi:hypothetical protein